MQAIFVNGDLGESHLGEIIAEVYTSKLYQPVIDAAKWKQVTTNISIQLGQFQSVQNVECPLTVVDAGANIGLTVGYFAPQAERVVAVEPCTAHVKCLKASKEYNNLGNVEIVQCALYDKDTVCALNHALNPTAHSLIDWNEGSSTCEDVSAITIETLCHDYNIETIDILKLDIEGAESEVVRSDGFRAMAPRIRYIAGEWHEWTMLSQEAFKRELVALGYRFIWLSVGNQKATIFVAWREGEMTPVYGQVNQ